MSRVCKILVAHTALENISKIVYQHLMEVHGDDIETEEADWPVGDYELFLPASAEPTIYCLKVLDNSFTELEFNSFNPSQELCEKISKELDTSVVVIIYYSVVSYCYWAYYQNGKQKRLIEYGDGEFLQNEGDLLPFETEPIGHNIAELEAGEQAFYVFEIEDMEEYNRAVGINALVYHDSDEGWQIIKSHSSASKLNMNRKTKPWWHFW